jgi:hypothetical protein
MASDGMRMVTVFVSAGHLPAEVIKGKLEAAGIPVLLRYESVGVIYGLTVDGLGRVDVQVPEELADDARLILEETSNWYEQLDATSWDSSDEVDAPDLDDQT